MNTKNNELKRLRRLVNIIVNRPSFIYLTQMLSIILYLVVFIYLIFKYVI